MLRRWTPREPDQGGLADECEAFLVGRYAELAHDIGRVVPCWAWVNELAHRSPSEIRLLADGRRERSRMGVWPSHVDTVAKALIEWARSDLDLERWQAEVLLPFELELIECDAGLEPGELVQSLLDAVIAHRRRRAGQFLTRSI